MSVDSSPLLRSVTIAVVFGLLLSSIYCGCNSPERYTACLRSGEGRLAGCAWSAPERPSRSRLKALRKALDHAARSLAANRAPSSLRQHADLLLQAREADRAVAELEEATALDPADARSWSDLAAAHLQRSAEREDPYEIVLALSAAHHAVRHDPALPAAKFNRALALTHLSLQADAAEDWRLFQRSERDPSWLREGRRHAAALSDSPVEPAEAQLQAVELAQEKGDEVQIRKLVARFPQQLRESTEETLLPGWAVAEIEHDGSESSRRLETACTIGRALTAQGDPMMEATCAHLKGLRTAAPRRFRLLVRGFIEYGKGLALAQDGDFYHALERFREAESTLTAQESPFAGWAAFQVALCHYQLSENGKARERLFALTRDSAKSSYKALQGRSFLMLGLMDVIEGNPTVALANRLRPLGLPECERTSFRSQDRVARGERPGLARPTGGGMAPDLSGSARARGAPTAQSLVDDLRGGLLHGPRAGRPRDRFGFPGRVAA